MDKNKRLSAELARKLEKIDWEGLHDAILGVCNRKHKPIEYEVTRGRLCFRPPLWA